MKTDLSRLLHDKYFGLVNRDIEVKLKNGTVIQGVIIGFCKGDEYSNESFITKWHIVNTEDKNTLGIDAFGFLIGKRIDQKELSEIKFLEDNTIINF